MDFRNEMQRAASLAARTGNIGLLLLWHILHLFVSIWYFMRGLIYVLESYLISAGILKSYKSLNVGKLQYLAIVVESEDAYETSKVTDLLQWLEAIGVKHVCLYDTEGVLKKSKEVILKKLKNAIAFEDAYQDESLVDQKCMSLEFCSFSDGKEAITKAANLLFVKYLTLANLGGDREEQIFTEPHMDDALKVVGGRGPDPDLLLVYGPARCHLGFPAWRIRYTEIVHMGQLKSMRYGSLIKAIYKFTTVRQNYGKQLRSPVEAVNLVNDTAFGRLYLRNAYAILEQFIMLTIGQGQSIRLEVVEFSWLMSTILSDMHVTINSDHDLSSSSG